MPLNIFLSFSPKDSTWSVKLKAMLEPDIENNMITVWDESDIEPGAEPAKEIKDALTKANAAILLVSPDYLASDYFRNELPPLLDASQERGLKVLWIYIHSCDYEATPIQKYSPLSHFSVPSKPEPLALLSEVNKEKALKSIASKIVDVADSIPKLVNTWPTQQTSNFYGRKKERKAVKDFIFDDHSVLLLIAGRPGIGKTALVQQVLEQRIMNAPGIFSSVVILSMKTSTLDPNSLFCGIAKWLPPASKAIVESLISDPKPVGKVQQLYRALKKRQVIVVVDGLEDIIDPTKSEITNEKFQGFKELLVNILRNGQRGIKIIVTSRILPVELAMERIDLQPSPISLEKLEDNEVITLLESLGQAVPVQLEKSVQERTGGNPQIIVKLVELLRNDHTSLEKLSTMDDVFPERLYKELCEKEFLALPEQMKRILQALAVFDRPVGQDAIDYLLAPLGLTNNQSMLDQLYRIYLVQKVKTSMMTYSLDQIEKSYVLDSIDDGTTLDRGNIGPSNITKFALYSRARCFPSAIERVQDLQSHMAEFALLLKCHEFDQAANLLLTEIGPYLAKWGYYTSVQLIKMHDLIWNGLNQRNQAVSLVSIGNAYLSIGRFQKAKECYREGIALADGQGDIPTLTNNLIGLANCLIEANKYGEAYNVCQDTVTLLKKSSGANGEDGQDARRKALASCYLNCALCQGYLGQLDEAQEFLSETSQDPMEQFFLIANKLAIQGELRLFEDNFDEAAKLFTDAIRISNDLYHKSRMCGELAIAYLACGRIGEAEQAIQQGLSLMYPSDQYIFACLLGMAAIMKGEGEVAEKLLTTAVGACEEFLAHCDRNANVLNNMGLAWCGLALCGRLESLGRAKLVFMEAQSMTTDFGVVKIVRMLLKRLSIYDKENMLEGILALT